MKRPTALASLLSLTLLSAGASASDIDHGEYQWDRELFEGRAYLQTAGSILFIISVILSSPCECYVCVRCRWEGCYVWFGHQADSR